MKLSVVVVLLSLVVGGLCGSSGGSHPKPPKPTAKSPAYMVSAGGTVYVFSETGNNNSYTVPYANTVAKFIDYDDDFYYIATSSGVYTYDTTSLKISSYADFVPEYMAIDYSSNFLRIYYTLPGGVLRVDETKFTDFYETGNDMLVWEGPAHKFAVDKDGHRLYILQDTALYKVEGDSYSRTMIASNITTPGYSFEDFDLNLIYDNDTGILMWGVRDTLICGIRLNETNPKVFKILEGHAISQIYSYGGVIYGVTNDTLWGCAITHCTPSTIDRLTAQPDPNSNILFIHEQLHYIDDRGTAVREAEGSYSVIFGPSKSIAFAPGDGYDPYYLKYSFYTITDSAAIYDDSTRDIYAALYPTSNSYFDQDMSNYSLAYVSPNLFYTNDGTLRVRGDTPYSSISGINQAYAITSGYSNSTYFLFAADPTDNYIKWSHLDTSSTNLSFARVQQFSPLPRILYYSNLEGNLYYDADGGIMKKNVLTSDPPTLAVATSSPVSGICKNTTNIFWLSGNTVYTRDLSMPSSSTQQLALPNLGPFNKGLYCYFPGSLPSSSSSSGVTASSASDDKSSTSQLMVSILYLLAALILLFV
eukprot:Phypoly_transcript_02846.p1 GENE.Phypoly_transcript_02846~~Phypoly_transcript_02846.p1  ORF type:complete len:588 (+),score=69.37 Phypoly_transcript_02846:339-2102(+)